MNQLGTTLSNPKYESEVSRNTNWRSRVDNETKSQLDWNKQWGYLVHGSSSPDALDSLLGKAGMSRRGPAPATSLLAANLLDSVLQQRHQASERTEKDSLEDFVHVYCTRANGNAGRPMPREEFRRPLCASHAYGWRPTLEVFSGMALRLR